MYLTKESVVINMEKTNIEKILEEIDNIERLSADMRYKINNDNLDLEVQLTSVIEWVKSIKRRINKEK